MGISPNQITEAIGRIGCRFEDRFRYELRFGNMDFKAVHLFLQNRFRIRGVSIERRIGQQIEGASGKIRGHVAGFYELHLDLMSSHLVKKGFRKAFDGPFARMIQRQQRKSHSSANGGYIDDRTAVALPEMGKKCLRRAKDPKYVDIELPLDLGFRRGFECAYRRVTCIIQQDIDFAERFQKIYEQSLRCVVYVSDLFLEDLRDSYPTLFDRLIAAQQIRYRNLETFFEAGMEQGVFNRLNAALFMVQDDAVLRRIMDPLFSIHYDMTLKQALMDFYQLKKYQLFQPDHVDSVQDSRTEQEIVNILKMIT